MKGLGEGARFWKESRCSTRLSGWMGQHALEEPYRRDRAKSQNPSNCRGLFSRKVPIHHLHFFLHTGAIAHVGEKPPPRLLYYDFIHLTWNGAIAAPRATSNYQIEITLV